MYISYGRKAYISNPTRSLAMQTTIHQHHITPNEQDTGVIKTLTTEVIPLWYINNLSKPNSCMLEDEVLYEKVKL